MLATPQSRFIFGTVPWYSALMAAGILFAIWWACREEKRLRLPEDTIIDLALRLIPCGIIGARLYYVAFAWDTFASNPISILYIWQGGLAIYGALIAGFIAGWLYCRRKKIPFLRVLDAIVPGLAMAQAIGRWGNYFNMEAYGLALENPALHFFPLAVFIPAGAGGTWHMATFFYESVWNLMVFSVLAGMRRHTKRDGDLLCWYMLLYGAGRLVIEELRTDSLMAMSTLRVSQLLSSGLCMLVPVVLLLRCGKVTRGMLASGIVWAAVSGAISLTSPETAFVGHAVLLPVMSGICAAACAKLFTEKRYVQAFPAILLMTGAVLVKLIPDAFSPTISTVVHCALFALMPIAASAALYPLTGSLSAAETEATRA